MSDTMVQQAITEIGSILKHISSGVTVITLDAQVHTVQKVFKKSKINPEGGGGTDMRIAYADAEKRKPKPDVMILLTDGETPYPAHAPSGMHCVIGIIPGYGGERAMKQAPGWAKVILIEDKKGKS
jgi:predicted metal-dependent peptidase